MITALLGRKLGMTQVFAEDGRLLEVTLLEVGPCAVVQRKTQKRDGYDAVQLGFQDMKESRCNKAMTGHFAKAEVGPKRILREFPCAADDDDEALAPGKELRVDLFDVGEHVDVAGTSKGKGFAGVQKRHGFKGGPGGHGSMFHRAPGSIGQSADPSRVPKGRRLPGHMGSKRITVKNLEVVRVDAEKNLLMVRGAVPGANGAVLEIRKSEKGAQ